MSLNLNGCGSGSSSTPVVTVPPTDVQVEVETALGTIQTTRTAGASLLSFKGIPYALPPTGERRFAAPSAIMAYDSTVLADDFASSCPQAESIIEGASSNEDCLYLNVYTPDVEGNYPVMVWIHGGAFVSGSGGEVYEPERLVAKGVVVVTVNYRLGALGFLTHDAVGLGNWGLLDQQMALHWVRDNIAAFGGDEANVTLFGESAGGHSVMSQLASPAAAGLFDKVIVQSGTFFSDQLSKADSDVIGNLIAAELGCTTSGEESVCLRDASVADLLAAQSKVLAEHAGNTYIPVHDVAYAAFPKSFASAITDGTFNMVPVLIGGNANEGRYFTALAEGSRFLAAKADGKTDLEAFQEAPLSNVDDYRAAVASLLSIDPGMDEVTVADDYLARQDSGDSDRFSLALSAIQTDWQFACPMLDLTKKLSPQVTTYGYDFSDQNAPSILASNQLPLSGFPMGAAHGFDVQYLLASEEVVRGRGGEDNQIALSDAMLNYWSQFAKTGNPNAAASTLTDWGDFDLSSPDILNLDAFSISTKTETDFAADHFCSYLESQNHT